MIVEAKKLNAYLSQELKKELGKEIVMDVRIVLSKNVGRTRYNLYFYIQAPNQYLEYKYSFNDGWIYDAISNNNDDVIISIFERITEGLTLLYNDVNFNNF